LNHGKPCFFHAFIVLAGQLSSACLDKEGEVSSEVLKFLKQGSVLGLGEGVSDELEVGHPVSLGEPSDFLQDATAIFLAVAGVLEVEVAEGALVPPASAGDLHREPAVIVVVLLDVCGCCGEVLVELVVGGYREGVQIYVCIGVVPEDLFVVSVDEAWDGAIGLLV